MAIGVHFLYSARSPPVQTFAAAERRFVQTLAELSHCNPFSPRRIELERTALGEAFDESDAVWSKSNDWGRDRPNNDLLYKRAEQIAQEVHRRLQDGSTMNESDRSLYE